MLQRKIMQSLSEWKARQNHYPLIVRGLRQIGKTYTVKEFGKQYYKHVVYVDLRENREIHRAFEGNFNVNEMVMAITLNEAAATFVPGETLLILDEIQDCPNARSSLKYWALDGRYDVIATGSFLGVRGFRQAYKRGIPVGYEEQITMYPLTFLEFLTNMNADPDAVDFVRKQIQNRSTIPQAMHDILRKYYLQYLVVGGMPEAVNVFLETHDMNQVRRVQRKILESVRDDFGRYVDASGNDRINESLKLRAEACLDSLPVQLSKDYKKFQYSLVRSNGHSPEKAEGLQYLLDMGLVYKSYNVREISSPLSVNRIDTEFKLFLADTGLLISMLDEGTAAQVISGDLSAYKGAIAENMVASILKADGCDLYYYHAPSGSPELDFIYSDDGVATIIECKSTNNRATSMKYVLANPQKYGVHPAVKIADANVGTGDGFVTLPLYALGFLVNEEKSFKVEDETAAFNEAYRRIRKSKEK